MTINQSLVLYGSAGGASIYVDHSRIDHSVAVKVTLSANYTLASSRPVGAPTRPSATGVSGANLDHPGKTIPSGTTIALIKAEADALVTAGKASYA